MLGWALVQWDWYPYELKKRHQELLSVERRLVPASQGAASGVTNPATTLIMAIQTLELWASGCLLCQSHSLWYLLQQP